MIAIRRPVGAPGAPKALALLLLVVLAVPAASAWSITTDPPKQSTQVPASWAAWTTDLAPRPGTSAISGRSMFPGDAAAALVGAVGCALGDVTGDGLGDLLVLVADPTSGVQTLQALAGPGFAEVVWEKVATAGQILQCAPDLDLDGTLDPILHTLGEATGPAAAGAASQAQQRVQQVLSGASGVAMLGRSATDQATGVSSTAAGAATGVAQQATSILLPAAAGAAAFLQTSATTAALPIPAGLPIPPLPVDALTVTLASAAELQILDAAGAVVATISVDEAGVNPLALAPVPLTGGLPDVAVLTQALAPVQQAAGGVPRLALYAADGTLSWATDLPASTGLPLLLPRAGDLDLDGVGDLVVSTVQQGVEQVPGAAFQVVSGIDGSILFDSGPAVAGLLTALPLGSLPGGAALLQVASLDAASGLALSALDGAGSTLWSIGIDGLAEPVNAVLDLHTGDVTGFTDLTGDAVPDVAVAVRQTSGMALQAIDGLTGEVVWNTTLDAVQTVVPVAVQTVGGAASAAGAAGDAATGALGQVDDVAGLAGSGVAAVQSGASSALLGLGTSATEATMALVDPITGAVQWVATAALPPGADIGSLSAVTGGDLDGDGIQDLLVTALANATGAGGSDAAGTTRSRSSAYAEPIGSGQADSVTAVSGASGETVYSASADGGEGLDFESGVSPQGESEEPEDGSNGVPGIGPEMLAVALLAAAVVWRRRKQA